MAPQFIFTMKDLRKVTPPGQGDPARASGCRSSPAPRSACSAPTARASARCCASWPAWTRTSSARPARPRASRIGFLPQEPQLDPEQERARARRGGGGATKRALLNRYEELLRRLVAMENAGRAGPAAGPDRRRRTCGSWTATLEIAMDALRLPPRRRRRDHALRRRAAARGPVQGPAAAARPAAAGRADQPPRRRVGGLAGAPPAGVPGHRRGRHPRPLLPRQRRRLDPGAGPRRGHPLAGQLLLLAGAEAEAAGPGGEGGVGPPAHPGARAGVGPHGAARPAGQEQGPPDAYEKLLAEQEATRSARGRPRSPSRPGRAWATWWSRPRGCARATATTC